MLLWLQANPPAVRASRYFDGLFRGDRNANTCDAIVLHLDTDILSNPDFRRHIVERFDVAVEDALEPVARGQQIANVIEAVGGWAELAEADAKRHVASPAVEATETWCVGVFRIWTADDLEALRGDALRDRFMTVLHRSESRPDAGPYSETDKSVERRRRFCEKHAGGYARLESQCPHYRDLVVKLADLAA